MTSLKVGIITCYFFFIETITILASMILCFLVVSIFQYEKSSKKHFTRRVTPIYQEIFSDKLSKFSVF